MDTLIPNIDDNFITEYTYNEHGLPVSAHIMTKENYRLKKLSEKIESIVTLEKDRTYVITISDGTFEDIDDVWKALRTYYAKCGCHFIVVSDRFTFEEINNYMQNALRDV